MSAPGRRLWALIALSVLMPIAAQAQAPGTSAPGASTPGAPGTPAPSAGQAPRAAAGLPNQSAVAGVVRKKTDPANPGGTAGVLTTGNMTYHGGPVQHTQKVYTIFWRSSDASYAFPGGYQATINQFVQDLSGSDYYGIATQYNDGTGYINTALVYGGTWLDTANLFPSTALTGGQLRAEVTRALAANPTWSNDADTSFQIYTPLNILNEDPNLCGVHYFASPHVGQIIRPISGCFPDAPYPNGTGGGIIDAAINVSAHEIIETVTDPAGTAWYFVDAGGEIGDLCNFDFGTRDAIDGSDITLNGHKYIVQQQWSNANSGCVMAATPPSITGQPASQSVAFGSTATVDVMVSGTTTPPVTYQWYTGASGFTATPIAAATHSTYQSPALSISTSYWVRVTNGVGSADSNTAFIALTAIPPSIISQPAPSQTIAYNAPANLSVNSLGSSTLTYQWYRGTSGVTTNPIAGATSSTYAPNLISNTNFWVRVSSSFGHADSNTATVTVNFTDNSLVTGTNVIKAVHLTEARARIDAVRAPIHGAYAYTNSITPGTAIHAVDIAEMQTALKEAYADRGLPQPSFSTSPALGAAIVVADIADLRAKVEALEP